jgi:NADH-quinone oxidoreductase subunit L
VNEIITDIGHPTWLPFSVIAARLMMAALFGAIIGCAKDDIKKALAGSTMSQIGMMVLAAGLGPIGYAYAIAHLLTHGFFKAGLFLGAGSVMHGMNDEVDMRRYGALRTAMPVTFATFGLGYLAIIGVPFLSGWWTKEGIIAASFGADHLPGGAVTGWILGGTALLVAGLTAFYMSRIMFMTFFGTRRWADDAHPHESPVSMTAPMAVLALGSIGLGAFLVVGYRFAEFIAPAAGNYVGEFDLAHMLFDPVALAALALMLVGVAVAWVRYGRGEVPVEQPAGNVVTVAARRDLYGDALNEELFMRPGQGLVQALRSVDDHAVDGAVRGVAAGVRAGSLGLRLSQTGFGRSYALTMVFGAVIAVAATVVVTVV